MEVMRVPKEQKPAINHKAPPLFLWHENKSWDAVSRLSHQFDPPSRILGLVKNMWTMHRGGVP